jgi:uncharacterized protein YndB with AHSA1/START domain
MAEGVIEEREGVATFRYERRLRKPIDVVWRAITDPDEIGRWTGTHRPTGQDRLRNEGLSFQRSA